METKQRPEFEELIQNAAAAYRHRITDARLEFYWRALCYYSLERIYAALDLWASRQKKRFPTPGEFVELASSLEPEVNRIPSIDIDRLMDLEKEYTLLMIKMDENKYQDINDYVRLRELSAVMNRVQLNLEKKVFNKK